MKIEGQRSCCRRENITVKKKSLERSEREEGKERAKREMGTGGKREIEVQDQEMRNTEPLS